MGGGAWGSHSQELTALRAGVMSRRVRAGIYDAKGGCFGGHACPDPVDVRAVALRAWADVPAADDQPLGVYRPIVGGPTLATPA